MAAAYRASARIVNCEYIQFHPTTLYIPHKPRKLLTEALRGEGALLVNRKGERFMTKYAPEQMELAPRHVVSRAIFQEIAATGDVCVFLDLKPVADKMDLDARFPTVSAACRAEGLDPKTQLIPVVPAAREMVNPTFCRSRSAVLLVSVRNWAVLCNIKSTLPCGVSKFFSKSGRLRSNTICPNRPSSSWANRIGPVRRTTA